MSYRRLLFFFLFSARAGVPNYVGYLEVFASQRSDSIQEISVDKQSKTFGSYFRLDKKIQLSLGGQHQLARISEIEIGPKSRIFVSDVAIPAVYQFEEDGKFMRKIGGKGSGPGEYIAPKSMSFDSKGNLYVMDSRLARIQVYHPNGDFSRTIKLGQNGSDFVVHSDGSIILFHSGKRNTLYKYSNEGQLILSFGENEAGEIPVSGGKVGIDSEGHIYELRPHSFQVRFYSKDGTFLKAIGKRSSLFKTLDKKVEDFKSLQEWEQSWTPMVGAFVLHQNNLVLTQMRIGSGERVKYLVSIYNVKGQILAEDLEFPNYVLNADAAGAIYLLESIDEKDPSAFFQPVILKYLFRE